MLKNMWYACEFSKDITAKPKKLQLLGQKLVMWRDAEDKVHVLSDLCAHRGGSLAGGWLTPDSNAIVCPYHGWQYDGTGQCLKIPAHPDRGIPKKARVDSYPTAEKYGFVFVFMGDLPEEERHPLPEIPELDDPRFKKIYGEYNWSVSYERAIENAMDPSHAPFVHGNRFGNPDKAEVADYEMTLTEWSGTAEITLFPPKGGSKGLWGALLRRKTKDDGGQTDVMTHVKAGFFLPNINLLNIPFPFGELYLIDANVPVDEHTTRSLYISLRTFFKGDWADKDAHKRVQYIFKQDDAVISEQRPELLPYDLSDELHVRSDALAVAYRRRRNQLIDQGWGIDMHQITGDGPRDTAVVIPSPARTNNPELKNAWVHKEVESAKVRSKGKAGSRANYESEDQTSIESGVETSSNGTAPADAEPVDTARSRA